jgi:flagellar biogenesis protein FliO
MDFVRQSLAAVLVVALLWTALGFLRKKGWAGIGRAKSAPGLLESRGKLALTARHSIQVVRIGDRNLVLAVHPDGITFLGDTVPSAGREPGEMGAT